MVTWYGINYAGTHATQWNFQNKEKSGWTGTSSFVLKVPLCNWRPSIIYSVPCDQILTQRKRVREVTIGFTFDWTKTGASFSSHSYCVLDAKPTTFRQ